MLILQTETNGKGAFYIEENGKRTAEMTYYILHSKMVIDHTEVDEKLRDQNVGTQLVDQGVAYAREKGFKIIPLCPFVKSLFAKDDKYDDVHV